MRTRPVAATIRVAARARALRAEGHDVISLAIGEPDFNTPAHIIDAAHAAALAGETKYTPITGTLACRAAIARKLARDNGLDATPDRIIVTNGSKQAIHDAFAATLEPGDEVVIPTPYWASYPLIAEMLGGVPVFVPCQDDFSLDPEALARAITPRTRWVVLNFPNNPSGAVCPAETLQAVTTIFKTGNNDIQVLSDDIYEHLIHDGTRHATLAAVAPTHRDRILTIGGVSKSYAMTGWRIGWATGNPQLIAAMATVQGNVTSGASSVAQAATIAALDGPQTPVETMRARFARRRDAALRELAATTTRLQTHRPDGAFYLFPSVAPLIGLSSAAGRFLDSDETVAEALLEEAHVATVSGTAFGASPHLRLSTACDDATLAEACRRIVRFCDAAA